MREVLFKKMLRIRRIEEAIADRYPEQEMRCPVHLSIGQEAIAVGVCSALSKEDYVVSTHRGHAHYLAKGGSFTAMLAEIYGKEVGCARGRGGSMHLIDLENGVLGTTPIVGGSLPIAVGSAFASFLKEERRVTAVFFGEGATEEGVFAECLTFAKLHALPVLFVCENNLYSVYSPLSVRQSEKRSIVKIAEAHGIDAEYGDGNDVEHVYKRSCEVVSSLKEGKGPFLFELATYRHREHCGPYFDNDIGYRTEEEFLKWKAKCPLQKMGNIAAQEAIEKEIRNEIEAAFALAKAAPFPTEVLSKESVFACEK